MTITGLNLPNPPVANASPFSSRSELYITVQTPAPTMEMPDTKNISGPPLRSPDTLRNMSKGNTQNTNIATPMKV